MSGRGANPLPDPAPAPWAPFGLAVTGCWLLISPATFGYSGTPEAWSDRGSGMLLVLLAAWALRPGGSLAAQWGAALTGTWLLLAPLVFWAEEPAAYVTSTLAGTLAIVLSILSPRTSIEKDLPGPDVPPGWSYNPSSRDQRAPIIAMAFLGFFLAQYLAAYQLGYHDLPWDPFFGDGTRRVLESDVSKAFPVSDAGLGAVAYLVEALTGFAGGPRRWRTLPWMVLLFGFLVVPAGVVSIVLIILQPIAVGAWCTFCLLTALTTLLMISPAADEVVATLQFLGRSRRAGRPVWRTFWQGGADEEGAAIPVPESRGSWLANALGLNRVTPTLALSAALGGWLMLSPAVLGTTGAAASSNHLAGPLVITVSVIALAEIGRTVRWLNVPLGLWLIAAPWLLDGSRPADAWSNGAAGVLLILLSIPRGRIEERFGGFNRYLV